MFVLSPCDSKSGEDCSALGCGLSCEQEAVHRLSHAEDRSARSSWQIHRSLDSNREAGRTCTQLNATPKRGSSPRVSKGVAPSLLSLGSEYALPHGRATAPPGPRNSLRCRRRWTRHCGHSLLPFRRGSGIKLG